MASIRIKLFFIAWIILSLRRLGAIKIVFEFKIPNRLQMNFELNNSIERTDEPIEIDRCEFVLDSFKRN